MGHSGMNITAEWAAVIVATVAAAASLSNIFFTNRITAEISKMREWVLTGFVAKGDFLNLLHLLRPGALDGSDDKK